MQGLAEAARIVQLGLIEELQDARLRSERKRGPCLRRQFRLRQADLASLGSVRVCVWHYIPVSSAEGPYVAGTGMLFRRR